MLEEKNYEPPLISSHCPAIVRLIQIKFPELVSNIVPIDTPLDITAELAKKYVSIKTGIEKEEVGVFFLTMCSAKVTAIKNPVGKEYSPVDGAISVAEIYDSLRKIVKKDIEIDQELVIPGSPGLGMGFDIMGCDKTGIKECVCLSVSGIDKAIKILQEIELRKIPQLEYLELYSCDGGCVAGMLNVQNPYVTQVRFREVMDSLSGNGSNYELLKEELPKDFTPQKITLSPRPIGGLSEDISNSLRKLGMLEKTLSDLPRIDCGACGAPTCRDFAEDIVQKRAEIHSCVFHLLNSVAELTGEAFSLAKKIPYVKDKTKTKRIDGSEDY
ncbi:[Fe-Fe] hydrogenase large subunit C-terminal domain-containing protein [Natranaerofaba carboxydovora]|uniref:[Fe-Fe] hydrogenase large subunit C-terminal domain-containing protein n=1 Tax=Natranaerofaba carboxydovora TaxID=2742683 RepID=UPI002402BEBF|nr:[Fe-Fe] hydrogenase large subunit C-terminal domain-containing protein [Natranaerofaba carboxydovora]